MCDVSASAFVVVRADRVGRPRPGSQKGNPSRATGLGPSIFMRPGPMAGHSAVAPARRRGGGGRFTLGPTMPRFIQPELPYDDDLDDDQVYEVMTQDEPPLPSFASREESLIRSVVRLWEETRDRDDPRMDRLYFDFREKGLTHLWAAAMERVRRRTGDGTNGAPSRLPRAVVAVRASCGERVMRKGGR